MSEFGPKKQPGDRQLSARAWNALTETQTFKRDQPISLQTNNRDYDQAKIENSSGYDQEPFGVLKAEGSATWEDRTDAFFTREGMRNGAEISGTMPESEWNQVSILQKSAPSGKFAQGVTSGPTPVFVEFPDDASLDYPFAVPKSGDSSKLKASPYGLNRILWHADPETAQTGCDPRTLQAYVNMGEDGQWVFFKLRADLSCCGSASALLVDECGTQIGECPIIKTVYGPACLETGECDCEGEWAQGADSEGGSAVWKTGETVLFWWVQYLQKWVTIPKVPGPPENGGAFSAVSDVSLGASECGVLNVSHSTSVYALKCGKLCKESENLVTDTIQLFEEKDVPIPSGFVVTDLELETQDQEIASGITVRPAGFHLSGEETVTLPTGGTFELSGTDKTVVTDVSAEAVTLSTTRAVLHPVESASHNLALETTGVQVVDDVSLSDLSIGFSTTNRTVLSSAVLVPGTAETITRPRITGITTTPGALKVRVTLQKASGLDWTGVSFDVDLSGAVEEKTVVTSVSVDGCNVVGTTETVQVLKASPVVSVSMTGEPSITYTSETVEASVTLNEGASLCTLETAEDDDTLVTSVIQPFLAAESVTFGTIQSITASGGELTVTKKTVEIPTGITGEITLNRGGALDVITSVNYSGGTVTPAYETFTVPNSATFTASGSTTFTIPSTVTADADAIELTTQTVPIPTGNVTSITVEPTVTNVRLLQCPETEVNHG